MKTRTTAQEGNVWHRIALGFPNNEIASQLEVTEKTVKNTAVALGRRVFPDATLRGGSLRVRLALAFWSERGQVPPDPRAMPRPPELAEGLLYGDR